MPGYRTSLEPTVSGITLGVDTRHRLLEDRTVAECMAGYLEQVRKHPDNKNYTQEKIESDFRELCDRRLAQRSIITLYNKKIWKIDHIDWNATKDTVIPGSNPVLTIEQYYHLHYDCELTNEAAGITFFIFIFIFFFIFFFFCN